MMKQTGRFERHPCMNCGRKTVTYVKGVGFLCDRCFKNTEVKE